MKAIIGTMVARRSHALGPAGEPHRRNVETAIRAVRSELADSRIGRLHDEMQENYHRLDERMRPIEQGSAGAFRRRRCRVVDTLERSP